MASKINQCKMRMPCEEATVYTGTVSQKCNMFISTTVPGVLSNHKNLQTYANKECGTKVIAEEVNEKCLIGYY